MIYNLFDKIFSSMTTKNVQVGSVSGRICHYLASRIRILNTRLTDSRIWIWKKYLQILNTAHNGRKMWMFRWYTVPTAVILVRAVETLRQAGALEVARNALTAHAPHLVRPASQLNSNALTLYGNSAPDIIENCGSRHPNLSTIK
jgi:hypothetical protein